MTPAICCSPRTVDRGAYVRRTLFVMALRSMGFGAADEECSRFPRDVLSTMANEARGGSPDAIELALDTRSAVGTSAAPTAVTPGG